MVSSNNKKVLLMYPPNQLMDIETPRPDGSLGPLYLAGELQRKGYGVDILDASVGPEGASLKNTFHRRIKQENGLTRIGMGFDEIGEHVAKGGYGEVGISSNFTPQTSMVFQTAEAIRRAAPDVEIYTGGVNARALKERFLNTGYFDGICLTEGELVFPRMVEAHRTGQGLEGVPGVAYNDGGRIALNPVDPTCFPTHLDDLAMPAWELLPFGQYDGLLSAHGIDVTGKPPQRYGPIMTSRGCPFVCAFCHISTEKDDIGKYRMHSIGRVISEIDRLEELDVRKIFFEDDSLLADRERVKTIFGQLPGRGLSILDVNGVNLVHLYDRTKGLVDGHYPIDHEYLHILRDAGFDQIVFPLESGSKRIQKKYATNKVLLDRMDLVELMRAMTDVGIKAPINTMIGFPDETREEMQMSFDLSRRLVEEGGAPYVTFFHPIPFPGSRLFDMAIEGGYLPRNFNTDDMNWKHPVMVNTTVPPEEIEALTDEAWRDINPDSYIARRLAESAGASHRIAT